MTPAECKTLAAAKAAAGAIFEARIVVARTTGDPDSAVDRALYRLEHAFWKRADELAAKRRAKK